ncbi:MAG: DUF1003 domain-containing protein [Anaerolineales bacterium]|nr:DUF1003 domain-containing protein [Anaerolineales bacterium]
MTQPHQEQLIKLFIEKFGSLSKQEKKFFHKLLQREEIASNTNQEFDNTLTYGQRVADKVAAFGGSWTFIILFTSLLLLWIITNTFVLARYNDAFDPYPYILLNLILSMLAALQAPVIMMSQNRQAAKDRLDAAHDYEVNLKAELEIEKLHHKLDELREKQWLELVEMQQEQIRLLTKLLEDQTR